MDLSNYSCKFFGGNETLSYYLNSIRKYKVPTPEEEEKLFERIQNGDEKAKEEIVKCNQRFVYSVAKLYARDENEVLDYVDEGNLGLMKAIETFDPSKGFKFITHAVWRIRQFMNYYMTNTNRAIRRPNDMRLEKKVSRARDRFYVENGYYATDDMIMDIVNDIYGLNIKDKSDISEYNVTSVSESINDNGYDVEDNSEYNRQTSTTMDYESDIENDYYKEIVNGILDQSGMADKNKDIIKMLFGIGYDRSYTVAEVGMKYNLEDSVVNEVKNMTIKYLQQNKSSYRIAI